MRFKTVIPIYDWADLTVILKEIVIDEGDGTLCRGNCYRNEQHIFIELETHRLSHGAIAHEAGHAAWEILHLSGVKISQSNHEALAYLKDWIVRWIEYRLRSAGVVIASKTAFKGHGKMSRTKNVPKFK